MTFRAAHDDETVGLEAVLGEHAHPDPREAADITGVRTVITTLVEIVAHPVRPYPLNELMPLIHVSAEHTSPEAARGHVRRLALAILALLDLMGDVAS